MTGSPTGRNLSETSSKDFRSSNGQGTSNSEGEKHGSINVHVTSPPRQMSNQELEVKEMSVAEGDNINSVTELSESFSDVSIQTIGGDPQPMEGHQNIQHEERKTDPLANINLESIEAPLATSSVISPTIKVDFIIHKMQI